MKIYAHRGASRTHPENTLDAFAEAIQVGADGIELDIHCTADDVPVVMHDRSLERTAGVDRDVNQISLEELRQIAPQVPSLDEVFALVGGKLHFDLEVKQENIVEQTLAVIDRHPELRWAVSSFDWNVIRAFRSQQPASDLWLLGMTLAEDMISTAQEIGATTLALHDLAVGEDTVPRANEAGYEVMVWTVNDPVRGQTLKRWGVSAICTDTPADFMSAP
ncbi:MAG: glycerophosphodiester phosphodiesterase [Chloroflexota bacterium]|nr:glycerophosphodiester phosphodiesterase [Chloroflexota bacterium]